MTTEDADDSDDETMDKIHAFAPNATDPDNSPERESRFVPCTRGDPASEEDADAIDVDVGTDSRLPVSPGILLFAVGIAVFTLGLHPMLSLLAVGAIAVGGYAAHDDLPM